MLDKVFNRDIVIVMGAMNAKLGCDNTGIESVMGQQGAKCKMNENGELLTNFCAANELVIGNTLFSHNKCHKVRWVSPDRKKQNHLMNSAPLYVMNSAPLYVMNSAPLFAERNAEWNGKAAGLDNIPAETIKAGEDISFNVLHVFLNEIWKEEELPEEWTTGLLIKL